MVFLPISNDKGWIRQGIVVPGDLAVAFGDVAVHHKPSLMPAFARLIEV
jgi:hypothetical protein